MITVQKVYAYITQGRRLLVFRHVNEPEAGIQVPGGTVQDGEAPRAAALREGYEETGLENLEMVSCLGETEFDQSIYGKNEIHHRYFFHLRCSGSLPERWQHWEEDASDGSGRHLFELYWIDLSKETPDLVAGQGALLHLIGKGEASGS